MPNISYLGKTVKNDEVVGRQIAFFAAFVLPMYKLLEIPSILARFTKGDLLLPAFLQFVLQTGVIIALLCVAAHAGKSGKTLFELMDEKLGKWALAVYIGLSVYYAFAAVLPLLDLEKFVYAAFYDTPPTLFSFAFFFLFCGFACTKGIKALGRCADLSLFLFLLPFLVLLIMSIEEADATNLLPLFEQNLRGTTQAMRYTALHFSDAMFLLPLIGNLRFQKNDGKKIVGGYFGGALCVLFFLGVFYSVYSTLAPMQHYAFSKIAQYFPVLSVIGRLDLLLVYMLCVVLFFQVSAPLQYTCVCIAKTVNTNRKTLFATAVAIVAFLFVLFFNRYYDNVYALFCQTLSPVFIAFAYLIPLAFLLLRIPKKNDKANNKEHNKEEKHA